MPDYSRKRFNRIKLKYPDQKACLLLAANEPASIFWSYDDDAIEISEKLNIRYSVSKKGPVISVTDEDLSSCRLISFGKGKGAFYLIFEGQIHAAPIDPWDEGNDHLPPTALLRAKVIYGSEIKSIVVVSDSKYQDSASGIYWENRAISINLFSALHTGARCFALNDEFYIILRVYYTEEYFEKEERRFHFLDAKSEPKTIFVSNLMHFGAADKFEPVTALFYHAASSEPALMTVYYSYDEKAYYIDSPTFEQFREKYGLPYVSLTRVPGEKSSTILAEQSELFLYGYNVKKTGANTRERQNLLAQLMDCGLMTKGEIRDHISWLISFTGANLTMADAKQKWKEDLLFIDSYHRKDQREIWAAGFTAKSR